jgi:uncharacterized integral membrane protein
MESIGSVGLTVLLVVVGVVISITFLENYDKRFFLIYMTAMPFFLFAASISVLCVLNIISGAWTVPAVVAVLGCVMIGSMIFSFATQERLFHKMEELKKPLNPTEVEKGINWKKVEKWLAKK